MFIVAINTLSEFKIVVCMSLDLITHRHQVKSG